jgi:hypothetical protein
MVLLFGQRSSPTFPKITCQVYDFSTPEKKRIRGVQQVVEDVRKTGK